MPARACDIRCNIRCSRRTLNPRCGSRTPDAGSPATTATLAQAVAQRGSCGLMLVAIDNLARVNEAYGFDVADEVIGAVAKRLRAKMRGGDVVGRYSGNKFGVILKTCTPDDIATAAERLLAGVRDDVVQTQAGPVAV